MPQGTEKEHKPSRRSASGSIIVIRKGKEVNEDRILPKMMQIAQTTFPPGQIWVLIKELFLLVSKKRQTKLACVQRLCSALITTKASWRSLQSLEPGAGSQRVCYPAHTG